MSTSNKKEQAGVTSKAAIETSVLMNNPAEKATPEAGQKAPDQKHRH